MANKSLFSPPPRPVVKPGVKPLITPVATTRNLAGGKAYSTEARHQLAQYAATGTLSNTFYASAKEHLDTLLGIVEKVDSEFIAKVALYSREFGRMKDMPALLCATLAARHENELLGKVFPLVIDNGKMVRNFLQILNSRKLGRRSIAHFPRRLLVQWFATRTDKQLIAASVGTSPTFRTLVQLVHPTSMAPGGSDVESDAVRIARRALIGYLAGWRADVKVLPPELKALDHFYKNPGKGITPPQVPFELLTSIEMSAKQWQTVGERMSWTQLRMNLMSLHRHGALTGGYAKYVAEKLANEELIRATKPFPYQILSAYLEAEAGGLPPAIIKALHDAMEIACENIPVLEGRLYVMPDVSGSMSSPITGHRAGSTSSMSCGLVASLLTAALVRKNPEATVLAFDDRTHLKTIKGDKSIIETTKALAFQGGGTNCAAPLSWINTKKAAVDTAVMISDNESWVQLGGRHRSSGTDMMGQWNLIKQRNVDARLACIDLVPNTSVQAVDREDILNIGGFSDTVFTVLGHFASGKLEGRTWTDLIESEIKLP